MRDYLALTKPRITWLILMSTCIDYFFGISSAGGWLSLYEHLDTWNAFHTLLGVGLIALALRP